MGRAVPPGGGGVGNKGPGLDLLSRAGRLVPQGALVGTAKEAWARGLPVSLCVVVVDESHPTFKWGTRFFVPKDHILFVFASGSPFNVVEMRVCRPSSPSSPNSPISIPLWPKFAWTILMTELAPRDSSGNYQRPQYTFTGRIGTALRRRTLSAKLFLCIEPIVVFLTLGHLRFILEVTDCDTGNTLPPLLIFIAEDLTKPASHGKYGEGLAVFLGDEIHPPHTHWQQTYSPHPREIARTRDPGSF